MVTFCHYPTYMFFCHLVLTIECECRRVNQTPYSYRLLKNSETLPFRLLFDTIEVRNRASFVKVPVQVFLKHFFVVLESFSTNEQVVFSSRLLFCCRSAMTGKD